jgi:PAS domain S-box-containing protein
MSTSASLDLVSRLSALLAGDDPEQALQTSRALLADVPDEATRCAVEGLLRVARARVADRDELRRTRERLAMLSAASFEGIFVHIDNVMVDINQRFTEMVGYPPEEVVGRNLARLLVAPEDLQTVLDRVERRLEGAYVVTVVRKDGSRFRAELSSKQGFLGERPVRVVAFRDVTDRERLERDLRASEEAVRRLNAELEDRITARTEELSAANRELESFSYSVSHDLRAPLRAINGLALILLEDYGDRLDDEAREHIQQMRAASVRMGELVDGLLSIARIGRARLHREPVDLSAIAREVTQSLQAEAPRRQVSTTIQPALVVRGDPVLLRTALWNLISNAWKFSAGRERAEISVSSRATPRGRAIVVSDNGVGFDMGHAAMLFRPFHRLHGQHEFAGSGIGLATVARVIARHDGQIWAEAEPGRGAAFLFTLPD